MCGFCVLLIMHPVSMTIDSRTNHNNAHTINYTLQMSVKYENIILTFSTCLSQSVRRTIRKRVTDKITTTPIIAP